MKAYEILFFGVAVLLPLVGGGTLLYFLAKSNKEVAGEEPSKKSDGAPKE